jgi:hypothetical protein
VVCVREAFYNVRYILLSGILLRSPPNVQVPVRRSSHVDRSKTFDLVQKAIESFALVFPEVTFTLDDSTRSKQDTGKGRVFTVPKVRILHTCRISLVIIFLDWIFVSVFLAFVWAFIGGGMIPARRQLAIYTYFYKSVECISAVSGGLKLDGFISCEGSQSKVRHYPNSRIGGLMFTFTRVINTSVMIHPSLYVAKAYRN